MKKQKLPIVLFLAAFTVIVAGCGGEKKPEGLPPLTPLTVTITQTGTPLEKASVRFIETVSDKGAQKWSVSGVTDDKGEAIMKTHGFPGVPVGSYKVVVSKEEIVYDNGTPPNVTDRLNLVEKKYTNIRETDLKADIAEGTATITFDVGKAVREKMATPP